MSSDGLKAKRYWGVRGFGRFRELVVSVLRVLGVGFQGLGA